MCESKAREAMIMSSNRLLCTKCIDGISFSFPFLDHPHNELVLNFYVHEFLIYADVGETKDIRKNVCCDDNN